MAAPRSIPVTWGTLSNAAKVTRLQTSGSTLGLTIKINAQSDASCPGSEPSPPDVWWYEGVTEWAKENKVQMQHLMPAIDSTMKGLAEYVSSRASQDLPKPFTTAGGTSLSCPRPTSLQSTTFGLLIDADPEIAEPIKCVRRALMSARRRDKQRNIFILYEEDQDVDAGSEGGQSSENEDDNPLLQRDF